MTLKRQYQKFCNHLFQLAINDLFMSRSLSPIFIFIGSERYGRRVLQWTLVHGRPYDLVHQIRYCNTISNATDKQHRVITGRLDITRSDSRTAQLWPRYQDEHMWSNSKARYVVIYLVRIDIYRYIQTTCVLVIYYKHDLCILQSFIEF